MGYVMGNSAGNQTALQAGDYLRFGDMWRPLMHAILKVPEFSVAYESYISKFVKELYNLQFLGPRIDALKSMLAQGISWNHSLTRMIGEYGSSALKEMEKV